MLLTFAGSQSIADETYSSGEIMEIAGEFFGGTTEGLASLVEKAFAELGKPNGFIAGEELSGAFVVGLRYGEGMLVRKRSNAVRVYWRGPSIGWDFGGNAAKVFTLIYNIQTDEQLFQLFPGVDGSFYFIGGFGINYQQHDTIILAPIRTGIGLRVGANLGYLRYSKQKEYALF